MRSLVIASIGLAAATASADPQLVGRVTETASRTPIEGATVTVGDHVTTTNAYGIYRIVLRAAGDYAVAFSYGNVRVTRDIAVGEGKAAVLDTTLDVDRGEIIEVHGHLVKPVSAQPVADINILPRYSDDAIEHDVWARAWLLLDIDETGTVTRVKLLHHPGHDLDAIAVDEAMARKFTPARDEYDRPKRSYVVWPMEWPSWGWMVARAGVVTRMPSFMRHVPCRGSGPMRLESIYPVYRDCSMPDLSKVESEPWVTRVIQPARPAAR